MYSFEELFATYLSEETLKIFGNVNIGECKLNSDTRSLSLKLYSGEYIPSAAINNLREEIKGALQLEGDTIEITFASDAFCIDAVSDTVDRKSVV